NSATICSGGTATLIASGASTYSWSNGSTTTSITVSPTSNTSYTVTGMSGSCSGNTIASVNIGSSLNVSVNSATICPGGTVTLIASGASTYSWSNGSTTPSITVSPANNTSYTVTGMSGTCSNSFVSMVTIAAALAINVNSVTICQGETASITASGASSYEWSTGDTTSTIFIMPMVNTTCTVIGNSAGCTGTAVTVINVNVKPNANVSPDISVVSGNSAPLLASGGTSYNWTPSAGLSCSNCPDPMANPLDKTKYCVEVINSEGCRDTACTTVSVENKEIKCGNLFVPTAFSPNNDGVNDVACVLGNCIMKMRFMIFDRWGEKVFESSSTKETWDGNIHGKPMETAVFVYYLKATLVNGDEISLKGNITLMR
ncbi:MAG: T9SS type B sorting domain-containing protein, partial [Bacteroidia bacterium]